MPPNKSSIKNVSEWRGSVTTSLDFIKKDIKEMKLDIKDLRNKITNQRIKIATIGGSVGALVGALVSFLIMKMA